MLIVTKQTLCGVYEQEIENIFLLIHILTP